MATDLDPLDEIFTERAANTARAGVKFQPKAKPRPRKESSAIPSTQSVQAVDIAKLSPTVGPSLASPETLETRKSLENVEDSVLGVNSCDDSAVVNPSLEHVVIGDTLGLSVGLNSDVVICNVKEDWHSTPEKLAGEAIPMGTGLDPLDEIFSERAANNARAGVKFQPKAKPRPRKEPVIIPSTQSQAVDIAEKEVTPLVGSSLASAETLDTKMSLENNESHVSGVHSCYDPAVSNSSLEHHLIGEALGGSVGDCAHANVAIPDVNGDWHSTSGKSAGESADIFMGLESLDDFYSQSTSTMVGAASRTPEKVDLSVQLGNEFSTSCLLNNEAEGIGAPSEIACVRVFDTRSVEEEPLIPVVSPLDHATIRTSNASSSYPCTEATISQDPLICGKAVISNSDGGFLDNLYELTTRSGQRSGKFKPKSKAQINREKPGARNCIYGDESVECLQDAQSVPSESEYINKGSLPEFPPTGLLDFSSLRFDDSTSQIAENEEPMNPVETSRSDALFPGEQAEAVPEIPEMVSPTAKRKKRKPLERQQASISGQENETGRSTRQLRKRRNVCELVDEPEDEADDDENYTIESPSGSCIHEYDRDDGEYQMTNDTQNRKAPRKSNKAAPQKEKPVRKRKKANEVPDQATKEPPKKFSHSTQRKRRQVDKVLLETPEDEIDMSKLRIRDIILLAEHRERISSKEGKTSEAPITNKSAHSYFDHCNEEEPFPSEQGGISDDQTNPTVQESSTYTNYHSYMKKTPRSRWSKRDTELFYKAVRQFGTDLSMIQQLFPGRTRNQIKKKYKKEEKYYPLRLLEAETTRPEDHSHFQLVIERLKENAAQEKENSCRDDSIPLTGEEEEEEEVNPKIDEEVAKPEGEEGEVEADVSEVRSPVKSHDSDDDLSRWSQYKSEL